MHKYKDGQYLNRKIPYLSYIIGIANCHHLYLSFMDAFCFYLLETTVKQIEDAFKEFTTRTDIAIVLISQYVSCLLNVLSYRIIYFLMIVKVCHEQKSCC